MTSEELILLLSHHPKLGAQSIKKILATGIKLSQPDNRLAKFVGEKIATYANDALKNISLDKIKNDLCSKNIGYITFLDKCFSSLLLEIPDCPVILFIKGNAESLNQIGIGVVGSRKYTNYGARIANKFSLSLASTGLTIISGLALGIDSIAHRAALDAGGTTIAVLGCGLDRIYPSSNQGLAMEMIESNGAVVSEYPPGTEPFKSNFPARNRIIAGLSPGTLIIEAAKDSGALITATAALDYNREVYAIPGPIDSTSSEGTNFLIQQGAKLTTSLDDIIEDFNIVDRKNQKIAKEYLPQTEEEKVIIELISSTTLSADEIVRKTDRNVAEVSYALTMLEMKGILENVSGNWRKKL